MLGYYKQDELNREVKQNGWIRTGDLGALTHDGYLTVLGRKKSVICTAQGRAIFPEELEILVSRSPYVKECAVIGIKNTEDRTNDVVAVIYPDYAYAKEALGVYSSRPMVREKLASLISSVNARLPQYKRISYFVQLDEEIPKNVCQMGSRHMVKKAGLGGKTYLQGEFFQLAVKADLPSGGLIGQTVHRIGDITLSPQGHTAVDLFFFIVGKTGDQKRITLGIEPFHRARLLCL